MNAVSYPSTQVFLTARWTNLFLSTYSVPPELLKPLLPPGVEIDTRDGMAFVSLVAFDFLDTRVFGVRWPGYVNFPEVNLRFYVRHGGHRGVVFIRELVPKRLIAWSARYLYNEPYRATPMTSQIRDEPDQITVVHRIIWGGKEHSIQATGSKPAIIPPADSVEHFFKEHEWGYGVTRRGVPMVYRVEHPVWQVYPVASWRIDLDWVAIYGEQWRFLTEQQPYSTVLAAGSAVAVYRGISLPKV